VTGEEDRKALATALMRARLVSVGMLIGPGIYVFMGELLRRNTPPSEKPLLESSTADSLLAAFVAAGILLCVVAAMLRSKRLSPEGVRRRVKDIPQFVRTYLRWQVLTMSMAETIGVLGLVYFILTREFDKLVIMAGAAVVAGILFFPTRSRFDMLADAIGTKGEDDAWRP
jgi:MFS family permease